MRKVKVCVFSILCASMLMIMADVRGVQASELSKNDNKHISIMEKTPRGFESYFMEERVDVNSDELHGGFTIRVRVDYSAGTNSWKVGGYYIVNSDLKGGVATINYYRSDPIGTRVTANKSIVVGYKINGSKGVLLEELQIQIN